MIEIEILASLSTLICVYLMAKQIRYAWLFSILGSIGYLLVFKNQFMYSQVLLQAIFIIQSIHGWFSWNKPELKMNTIFSKDKSYFVRLIFVFICLWLLCFGISIFLESQLPIIDCTLTTLSIIATYYLSIRILESWFLWIIVNISYIILFSYLSLYTSVGLYIVLLLLSIRGLLDWSWKSQF